MNTLTWLANIKRRLIYNDNSTGDPKLYAISPTQVFVTQKCKHRRSLVQNLIQKLMFYQCLTVYDSHSWYILNFICRGQPVHFWVINSYNWQLFGNYHFSDQFVLKITPYKRDLGVKVDIFDPQLELKIHFWVINNWESWHTTIYDPKVHILALIILPVINVILGI